MIVRQVISPGLRTSSTATYGQGKKKVATKALQARTSWEDSERLN